MITSVKKPGRPQRCRRIRHSLHNVHFVPDDLNDQEQIVLGLDELEAIRLTSLEGLYQAEAAKMMNVSRQTLGRILKSAHRKIADSLINGKILTIHGGNVRHQHHGIDQEQQGYCICPKCETRQVHHTGRPCQSSPCPNCGGKMLREGSEHH